MNRPLIIIAFWICLVPLALKAQQKQDDAVYLNNGSIMRGKVLESAPGKGVKMEIVGNNVLVIPENEILKIVFRESLSIEPAGSEISKPGKLGIHPQVHILGGSDQTWGFTIQAGYHLPPGINVGAGTGVEKFRNAMMPVFGQITWNIVPGKLSPYVYGMAGYAFSLERSYDYYYYQSNAKNFGGILTGCGIGIKNDISDRAFVTFSIGYRYQKDRITFTYEPGYWGGYEMKTERVEQFNRIVLSLGFMFR